MKIIFLDVDGELTYSNYRNRETENIGSEFGQKVEDIFEEVVYDFKSQTWMV